VSSYACYAYAVGTRGLRNGFGFSSKTRQKLSDFRRDFLIGNILFFIVLIFASVLINRSSRCIDETGVIIVYGILSGHSLFNFFIWTTYIPGLHRLLLQSCICCFERGKDLFMPATLERQIQISDIWLPSGVWHANESLAEPQPARGERASAVLKLDSPPQTEHQELLSGASSKPCDNCKKLRSTASEYCKQCKDWLCAECANAHREYQATTHGRHRVISADQRLKDETKAADVLQNRDDKQLRVEVVTLMADGIRQTVITISRSLSQTDPSTL